MSDKPDKFDRMAERDAIRASVIDQCNREGPYNAIGGAERIRALTKTPILARRLELEHKATIIAIAEEIEANDADEPIKSALARHDTEIRKQERERIVETLMFEASGWSHSDLNKANFIVALTNKIQPSCIATLSDRSEQQI